MGDRMDPSGTEVGMDFIHHMVHMGRLHYVTYRVRGGTAPRSLLVRTGSRRLHVTAQLTAGAATPAGILRNPTVTNPGTPTPALNYNEDYPDDQMDAKVFVGPAYTGGEERRETQAGFGNSAGQARSGDARAEAEYVWAPNTDHVFHFQPETATDTLLIISMYEVP